MWTDLSELILGFGLNLLVAVTIIRWIYYPATQEKAYVFTFLAFNTVIYFVLSLLTSVEISVGVGFGLFAIFSILRYRTDPIPIREMTYLFVLVALPVINSLASPLANLPVLLFVNAMMILVLWLLEKGWGFHYCDSKKLTYDRIALIKPENREALLMDLRERTGLEITRVEVGNIDLLDDTATLYIYYENVGEGRS